MAGHRSRSIQQSPEAHLRDADALIVRSAVYVDAAMLEKAPKVRVIGRAGVGVDNIDVEAATRRGIVVMNTPGANAVAVAELAIGLMISLARHLSRADASTRAGKWEKKTFQGTELRGKELGILGLGRIGVEVAKRAKALGMTVSAHDPYVSPALARDLGIKLCSLDDLYAGSDYLSLHLGLTPQTQGMINAEALAKDEEGRAHRQLRARRTGRRAGALRSDALGPAWPARRSTCLCRSRPRNRRCWSCPT